MLNQEQIGAYIAARRKAVGLTQAELGERLGITAQSVSNWERGETMPDTGLLQDLALILDTSADELLGAGSCGWRYRRRVTVERMSEAISCIQRLRELLGDDHFMYRTMIDALDKKMNSSIELIFKEERFRDAYVAEALCECARKGDYVDISDVRRNIKSERARNSAVEVLREFGLK